jgi:uncharacterized protein (UPF0335 family)
MVANLAEAKTHPIAPELFLRKHALIQGATREKEDSAAELARVSKDAKSAGVNSLAYKMLARVRKLDDDEQIIVMRNFIQYMQWLDMPVGTQFSLIDAPKVPSPRAKAKADLGLFDAREEGLRAGRDGDPASYNAHPPGSEKHVAWAEAWSKGLAERARIAAMGPDDEDGKPVADNGRATAVPGQRKRRAPSNAKLALDNAGHLNGGPTAH